ncbi:MAG: DUF1826 domain-containing protein [Pseudomonadota bacterium]
MTLVAHNAVPSSLPPFPNCVAMLDGPAAFEAVHKPGCAASIWRRELLPDFQAWLDSLAPKHLPEGRLIIQPEAVKDAVKQLCEIAATPDCAEREMLCNDIVALSELLCVTFKCAYLRLRLEKVTDNACCKFHRDAITARLVCTYRGRGTEYGLPDQAQGGDIDHNKIFAVPMGSPFLIRGSLWPETPFSNLQHRSPPIEGTGETRLLLVLDPISDPNDCV